MFFLHILYSSAELYLSFSSFLFLYSFLSKMPRSGKGRVTGAKRAEINNNRAVAAVNGKTEGVAFGRVTKILGSNHVLAALSSKHGPKEMRVRIPNVLGRKGATPITTRDVVTIYVGVEFDVDAPVKATDIFEITSILTQKQACGLRDDGRIPQWMMAEDGEKASKEENDAGGFVFGYDNEEEEEAAAAAAAAASDPNKPAFDRGAARSAAARADDEELNVDDI